MATAVAVEDFETAVCKEPFNNCSRASLGRGLKTDFMVDEPIPDLPWDSTPPYSILSSTISSMLSPPPSSVHVHLIGAFYGHTLMARL